MNDKAADEDFLTRSNFTARGNIGELDRRRYWRNNSEVLPSASVAVALMNSLAAVYPGKVKSKRAAPPVFVVTLPVPKRSLPVELERFTKN